MGQIMCKCFGSESVNQSEAWFPIDLFPKHLSKYASKTLAHDPARNYIIIKDYKNLST